MPEPKTRRKCAAHTAAPLASPPPIEKLDRVQEMLDKLYELGLDGNVSAAKLWFDITLKRSGDDPDALTAEQALAILEESRRSESPAPTTAR